MQDVHLAKPSDKQSPALFHNKVMPFARTKADTGSSLPSTAHRPPPRLVILCRSMIVVGHSAEFGFLIGTTKLYYWLLHTTTNAQYLPGYLTTGITQHTLGILIWFFAAVGGLHMLALVRTLFRSHRPESVNDATRARPSPTHPCNRFCSAYDNVLKKCIRPIMDVDGKYFDQWFLVQEFTEVICQTYQARQFAILIATRWINDVVVGMIFLNCVSSSLVFWFMPDSDPFRRRLVNMIVSAFLNLVNSVVIPLVIFIPYVRAFDPILQYMADEYLWNDVWFVNAVRENQQLFVTSQIDFATTIVPHLSILSSLVICDTILATQASSSKSSPVIAIRSTSIFKKDVTKKNLPRAAVNSPKHLKFFKRMELFAHILLCLSGLVVLGIHITAQCAPQLAGCKLPATPWFQPNRSCAVMNINCYRRGIEGNEEQVDDILQQLNSETLFMLILTHCPRLEISPSIHQLHRIQTLHIYNSTMSRWKAEASIRQHDHPELVLVTIIRTNLSDIPPGLMDLEMPTSMAQIVMYETNLTSLPAAVGERWLNVMSFWCVYCQLTQIPSSFLGLQLVITGNPIASIDFDVFARMTLVALDLAYTSISRIPAETNGSLDFLGFFALEFTQVDQVPLYVRKWYQENLDKGIWVRHTLHGSPYCSKEINDPEELSYQTNVCVTDHSWTTIPYPIDIVAPQRVP